MRLIKFLQLFVVGLLAFTSCVNNKRLVYLQDYSQPKSHDYLADTTMVQQPVDYRLEVNDVIYVKTNHLLLTESFPLVDDNNLGGSNNLQQLPYLVGYPVNQEGIIDLPTIGAVQVSGLTIHEAQEKVREAASKVLPDPAVKLFILNYYITVLGEVNSPGRYQVVNNRINIFEAMGMAQDATEFANREEVRVLRSRNGVNRLYPVDLNDQNIMASEAFFLQPNDVIIVKPQKRKKYANRDLQNVFNAIGTIVSVITLITVFERL